ncbi:MAG: type II secretion system GspH family protein [Gammaproteobacteria bacterium]|nr:type II secretion system GspH family protein [Gammaproteobacteria bacterium]
MKNIMDKVTGMSTPSNYKRAAHSGLSLLELIVFIVVMSIAVVAVMTGLSSALRGSLSPGQMTQATQLAQERMELILATRQTQGYSGIYDPCGVGSPPAFCSTMLGYTAAFSSEAWPVDTDTAKYQVLVVTVMRGGTQAAQYKTLVANY